MHPVTVSHLHELPEFTIETRKCLVVDPQECITHIEHSIEVVIEFCVFVDIDLIEFDRIVSALVCFLLELDDPLGEVDIA